MSIDPLRAYDPYIVANIQTIPSKYKYLLSPPLALPFVAVDINDKSSGYWDNAFYQEPSGEMLGSGFPLRQATFINGHAFTGRSFTVVSGVCDDDWFDPQYDTRGVLMDDGSAGASYEVLADYVAPEPETLLIILNRGFPPPSSNPTKANCYTRIEFMHGSTTNYSILMAYGELFQLQYSTDNSVTWKTYQQATRLGMCQQYIRSHNQRVEIKVQPQTQDGHFAVRIGDDGWLTHVPPGLTGDKSLWLPRGGKIRVLGKNGYSALCVLPYRHPAAKIGITFPLPVPAHPRSGESWLSVNALTSEPGQTITPTVTDHGDNTLTAEVTISQDDAGDGEGSAEPPRFTDFTVITPAQWALAVPGASTTNTITQLASYAVSEEEVWDDNRGILSCSGSLVVNNFNQQYNGNIGKFALNVQASVNGGSTLFNRGNYITGIGSEGFDYSNPSAGRHWITMPFQDRSIVMGSSSEEPVTFGFAVNFDQWPLWSAVRYCCEFGNIHGDWLTRLPDYLTYGIYVPPGGTLDAPYGKAGEDCPYPILGRGVGNNPLYQFGPSMSPWAVLRILCQDESAQVPDGLFGITTARYMMGFDPDGYFRFEPFAPWNVTPVIGMTDRLNFATANFPAVQWVELSGFNVFASASQLRSEITAFGQNWLTNELLNSTLMTSPQVRETIGYRIADFEQNERWGSQDYLDYVVGGMARQASLSTVCALGSIPFQPNLHAGAVFPILHSYLGPSPVNFYATLLRSGYGHTESGHQSVHSQFSARRVLNA